MERRSYSSRVVFLGLAISLAAAFVLAVYIHGHFASYQPKAVYHLPERVESVVWLNVEQNVGFDVFKRELLPLLEYGRTTPEPRVKHLERKTTVELEVDTRELVVAQLPDAHWLILLGGLFRRDEVTAGMMRLLSDLGIRAKRVDDLAVLEDGTSFGVSQDGVLILADAPEVAERAVRTNLDGKEWKPLLNKPGTVLNVLTYDGEMTFAGKHLLPKGAKRAWLSLEPGHPFPLFVEELGFSEEGLPTEVLPFSTLELKRLPGPDNLAHFSGIVSQAEFERALSAWAGELQELIWGEGRSR